MTDITEIVQHIDCNLTETIQHISVTITEGIGHGHTNYSILVAITETPADAIAAHLVSHAPDNAEQNDADVSQVEAETGTEVTTRSWSPLRVKQAITALGAVLFDAAGTASTAITAHLLSHAPDNAEKNSDITKAEIEAKLIGELISHTHAFGGVFTEIASQVEAEAGTDNTKGMTPLRTAEAIAALGSSGGGGAAYTWSEKIKGEIYTGALGYFVVPNELDGLDIKEIRMALIGLPTGAEVKVDIRKNGTASTDSIFTSDAPIEVATGESATNAVYQTGVNTAGTTVGTPGTTIDGARDTVAADDVLYIYVAQTGSVVTGADLLVEVSIG